jgi:hypothetical protein
MSGETRTSAMLFKDLDFGPDDAKGDTRLAEYFVRIPEYEHVRAGDACFVIGRKGTGKTAICEMIHDEARTRPDLFAVLLTFKNSPSADLFASNDKSFRSPNEYISIWRFLIVLELAKLMLKDESIDSRMRLALDSFLQLNFGNLEVASLEAVSSLRQREWKLGLDLADLGPLSLPSAEAGRSSVDASVTRIHFGRASAALLERLLRLQSDNEFFLLFDELDEDYIDDPRYYHLLISLFKAAYQIKQEIRGGLKVRPIVVLRQDIFSKLDDHDLNKMDDATVHLRWAPLPSPHSEFSLRNLVNERLRANLGIRLDGDLWQNAVDEDHWGGPGSSAWAYLLNRTMDRPRDIVKSLKCCQPFESQEQLSVRAISLARIDYSRWLASEVGNEIFRELPEYRAAYGVLTHLGKQRFSLQDWRSEFGKNEVLVGSRHSAEQVLEILYNYSVVGMLKRDRWLFKFKTPQVDFDRGCANFTVHMGFNKQFVIRERLPWDVSEAARMARGPAAGVIKGSENKNDSIRRRG